MRDAVIVSAARTAIGRAKKGSLRDTRPEYFASMMLEGLVERTPGLEKETVGDVIFGCAMPEGEQGMNVARLITLAAGFPTEVPAITVNRFCCSGSQTIALAADSIRAGNTDIAIAGGVESMSMVAMGGNLGMTADLSRVPCDQVERDDAILFSESAGRFIVTVDPANRESFEAIFNGLPCACIGSVSGKTDNVVIHGTAHKPIVSISVAELKTAWKKPFGDLI